MCVVNGKRNEIKLYVDINENFPKNTLRVKQRGMNLLETCVSTPGVFSNIVVDLCHSCLCFGISLFMHTLTFFLVV